MASKKQMLFQVFSTGPIGPTAAVQDRAADVHLYAARLIEAGHVDVTVGTCREDAVPFEEWRLQNPDSVPRETVILPLDLRRQA